MVQWIAPVFSAVKSIDAVPVASVTVSATKDVPLPRYPHASLKKRTRSPAAGCPPEKKRAVKTWLSPPTTLVLAGETATPVSWAEASVDARRKSARRMRDMRYFPGAAAFREI